MSEQSTDAVFARFDVILNVNNEKRERFDVAEVASEINEFLVCFEDVTDLNIEIFDVVFDEMIDEIVCEIVELLSFFLLKRDFIVLIVSFFTDLM